MEAFVDLRIFDGRSSMWFDSLNLPEKTLPYITRIIFTKWANRNNHREIEAIVPFFGSKHPKYKLILNSYDIMAYVFLLDDYPYWTSVLVEDKHKRIFPQLLRS
jgi:hypothetical protein